MPKKRDGFDYIGLLSDEEKIGATGSLVMSTADMEKMAQARGAQYAAEDKARFEAEQARRHDGYEDPRTHQWVYVTPLAARSCGANGMTWAHFLALAIFIACLVAVQYGWQQYKQRQA